MNLIDAIMNTINGNIFMTVLALSIIFFVLILLLILIISYIKALKKVNLSSLNVLWLLFPIVSNIVLGIKLDPVKNFGKKSGYLIGTILLPIIFVPLLAFSDLKVVENDNETANDNFDATNVINNNESTNVVNGESVQLNNIVENDINIEPVRYEMNQAEVNQTSNPVIPEIEEPIVDDNSNSFEENINPVNVENNIVDENIEIDKPVLELNNQRESIIEPVINDYVPVQRVNDVNLLDNNFNTVETGSISLEEQSSFMETVQSVESVSPVSEPTVNAFNSVPMSTPIENLNDINILDSKPFDVEEINSTPVETVEQKNICKNCGNELPSIVSICPNCGTDNE